MGRQSSEPRDTAGVHQPGRAWSNRGRCLDCGRRTQHPELCLACVAQLAGEAA